MALLLNKVLALGVIGLAIVAINSVGAQGGCKQDKINEDPYGNIYKPQPLGRRRPPKPRFTDDLKRLRKFCWKPLPMFKSGTSAIKKDTYAADEYTLSAKGEWEVKDLCSSTPNTTTTTMWYDGCYVYPKYRGWICPHVDCDTNMCKNVQSPNPYTFYSCQPDKYYYVVIGVACWDPHTNNWNPQKRHMFFPRCCVCKRYVWTCTK